MDGVRVKVLTMKEPPNATFPLVLEGLYSVPGEFIACSEWRRIPQDRMRRDIHTRRRHFFNKRVALVNYVAPETRPDEMLVDDSAGATVKQLGDALTELDVNGHFFGESSLTLAVFDRDTATVERAAAEAVKVMAAHDGTFVEETYNLLNAWLSVLPGNSAHNLRRLALLETNYADLSFLFTPDTGTKHCPHLRRDALAIFETRHHTRATGPCVGPSSRQRRRGVPLFTRVYIDPRERSRRRRPQALGVLGGRVCPSTLAMSCP